MRVFLGSSAEWRCFYCVLYFVFFFFLPSFVTLPEHRCSLPAGAAAVRLECFLWERREFRGVATSLPRPSRWRGRKMNASRQGGPNLWLLSLGLLEQCQAPPAPPGPCRGTGVRSRTAAGPCHSLHPRESCDAKGQHQELSAVSPCKCFNIAPNSLNRK